VKASDRTSLYPLNVMFILARIRESELRFRKGVGLFQDFKNISGYPGHKCIQYSKFGYFFWLSSVQIQFPSLDCNSVNVVMLLKVINFAILCRSENVRTHVF
jgi:hypothetical protein